MSWTNAVITDAGHRLQAALLGTGKGLVFTRAVTGAGLAEGELAAQTAVTDERQTLSLQPATPLEDAKTRVQVLLSNARLEAGYTMHQLGFYAKAQDEAEEILYALVQDETGDAIPADAESPGFTSDWSYVFAYGNADSVTVTVDPAGMITWDKVGAAGGVAPLGPDGKVPEEHLPETSNFTDADILSPETATKIGLSASSVPNDMFNVLTTVGDLHVWRRTVITEVGIPSGYTLGGIINGSFKLSLAFNGGVEVLWQYSDSITVQDNGDIILNSPTSVTIMGIDTSDVNVCRVFLGKFIRTEQSGTDFSPNVIYYIPNTATLQQIPNDGNYQIVISQYQNVTGTPAVPPGTHIDYPVSTNRNAYQEGSDAKEAGYTLGEVQSGKNTVSTVRHDSYYYSDSITVDSDGSISLVSPKTFKFEGSVSISDANSTLVGKFLKPFDENTTGLSDGVWFIPSSAVFTHDSYISVTYVSSVQKVTGYPAITDGTTIEYLGNLGDKTRMQIVSYVGTGTYGASHPCSITADFPIKSATVLGILSSNNVFQDINVSPNGAALSLVTLLLTTAYTQGIGFSQDIGKYAYGKMSTDKRTISWYSAGDAVDQLNVAGQKYFILCRG